MFALFLENEDESRNFFFCPRVQLVAIKLNGPPGGAALLCGRLLFTIVYLWTFLPAIPRTMINI